MTKRNLGGMVLVAYAGPESSAAALCASNTYRTTDIHSVIVNFTPPPPSLLLLCTSALYSFL
jgi:hypothetical protein